MTRTLRHAVRLAALLLLATAGSARAANQSFALSASAGTITLPGMGTTTTPIWGFSLAGGAATLPGPTLTVNQGDVVTVAFTNNLGEPVAVSFGGQALAPDLVGAGKDGGTTTYTFTAGAPGTFLYEAGLRPGSAHQAAMGLYGALVVRPLPATTPPQAYADAFTAYEAEAVVVVSELDPALNGSASPATFDMRNYAPKFFLLNGQAYPSTAGLTSAPGERLLLRYLNAGVQHHSMSLLGLNQTIVATDGLPRTYGQPVVAETLAPGQTMDAITRIPATSAVGSRFALFDGSLKLYNNTGMSTFAGTGGMLTFITAGTGTPPLPTGPTTGAVALSPNPTTGGAAVAVTAPMAGATGAELFIDATGAAGSGTAMTVAAGTATGTISTATLATLATGSHTIYVHGTDGTWGPFSFAALKVDKTGPATTGPTLTPGLVNAVAVSVAVHATGNDSAAGGSNVTAAEYAIDGATAVPMDVNVVAPIASLDKVIPNATIGALTSGSHTISIRSQDALGNWGTPATVILVKDSILPTASGLATAPAPATEMTSMRVTATLADASGIVAAEGFVDPPAAPATPPTGSGFQLAAADGTFGGTSEAVFADVPQATMALLSVGSHSIGVRGRDAAGNWGNLARASFTRTGAAVADTRTVTAGGGATQTVNVAAPGLLTNDLPVGAAGRTAALFTAPVRTAGTGAGTLRVTCGGATNQGVCADGSYRLTLTGTGNTNNQRAASKRGTFTFTYKMTLSGVTSAPATVTITVN